jgi:NAD-dependent deacetylase
MIYIFTGAGMAADSGLPTFRDTGGLWENYDINQVCNFPRFIKEQNIRDLTFQFYNERKLQYSMAKPHAGYLAIAKLQQQQPVKVITTNIDLLHEAAGTADVLHLHGRVDQMSCAQCYHYWDIVDHVFEPSECAVCGSVMVKPGIVFFGEMAPEYEALHWLIEDLKSTDTFVIVGTSLNVVNPIAMIRSAGKYPQIIFIDKNIPAAAKAHGVICMEETAEVGLLKWINAINQS